MNSIVKSIVHYNRKISFDYNIDQRIECGLVLTGTEVKSLRTQGCSIEQGHCAIINNTLVVYNMIIGPYKKCFHNNHDPHRPKTLLCHKSFIRKLRGSLKQHHWELVPEKVIFTNKNIAKIIIVIGKKAKLVDKRLKIKERDDRKEVQSIKNFYKV